MTVVNCDKPLKQTSISLLNWYKISFLSDHQTRSLILKILVWYSLACLLCAEDVSLKGKEKKKEKRWAWSGLIDCGKKIRIPLPRLEVSWLHLLAKKPPVPDFGESECEIERLESYKWHPVNYACKPPCFVCTEKSSYMTAINWNAIYGLRCTIRVLHWWNLSHVNTHHPNDFRGILLVYTNVKETRVGYLGWDFQGCLQDLDI